MKKKILKGKSASQKKPAIHFVNNYPGFTLRDQAATKLWLNKIAVARKRTILLLNYCFLNDEALLEINKDFLHHKTYTDIITFDYSAESRSLSGEIFISIDRVKENAGKFGNTFKDELHRVMAHGLLHLCGLGDKSVSESKRMRGAEENALDLRHF